MFVIVVGVPVAIETAKGEAAEDEIWHAGFDLFLGASGVFLEFFKRIVVFYAAFEGVEIELGGLGGFVEIAQLKVGHFFGSLADANAFAVVVLIKFCQDGLIVGPEFLLVCCTVGAFAAWLAVVGVTREVVELGDANFKIDFVVV